MSSQTLPYIGSKISLISNAEIRYEGTLYTINTQESTIALQNVRSFGTEGRKTPAVPKSSDVYHFIIFRGKDIKDLTVLSSPGKKGVGKDPAIVSVTSVPPAKGKQGPSWGWMDSQQWGGNRGADKGRGKGKDKGRGKGKDKPGKGKGQQKGQGGKVSKGKGKFGGGGGGGGGGEARSRRNRVPRNPVGELVPDENATAGKDVGTDFDFVAAQQIERSEEPGSVQVGYNKSSSFFDTISTDTSKRKEQMDPDAFRAEREKQREVDKDTFGATALKRPFGRRGRGRGGRRF